MTPFPPARLERALTLVVALLLALLAAAYAWRLPWQTDPSQLALPQLWNEVVRQGGLVRLAAVLPALVAATALAAAIIAAALAWIEPAHGEARRLRRALLLGAAAALYFFHLRLASPAFPARAIVDVLAHAVAGLALVDATVFLARFPVPARLDVLEAQAREAFPDPEPAAGWRAAANRRLQTWLARLLPGLFSESTARRNADWSRRQLALLDRPVFEVAVVAFATLTGIAFAWSRPDGALRSLADTLVMAPPLVMSLGITGLVANFNHGGGEARGRIGWIAVAPMLGFGLALAIFVGLSLRGLLSGDGSAATLFGLPLPALVMAWLVLLFPFLTACFVAGVALAVFHRGSLDPRLAIRRGAVLALCGVLLTAAFVALEGALTSQVVVRFGWPDHSGAIAAGTVAALGFAPIRRRVDTLVGGWVDRLMPAHDLAHGEPLRCSVAFVDLSGYTALAQQREHEALLHAGLLHKCARSEATRRGGVLVKTLGDAVMLRFDTPASAVEAIVATCRSYTRGAATLELEPLPLHAGLHHGDMIASRDGDLFGAGVNLAARLLGAAPEHELALSPDAAQELPHQALIIHPPARLKNLAEPMEIRALSLRQPDAGAAAAQPG